MERDRWISTLAVKGDGRKSGRSAPTLAALGLVMVAGLTACAGAPKDFLVAPAPSRTWSGPAYYGGPPPSWR